MDQKLELLKQVPLFAGLGRRELEDVGRIADEVDVSAGTELMHEGRIAHEFFVIVAGAIRIDRAGHTLNHLGPGDFLGEIALVDGGPRTATATATEPSRLLVLTHAGFHQLLDTSPAIRASILEALAQRLRRLEPDQPH